MIEDCRFENVDAESTILLSDIVSSSLWASLWYMFPLSFVSDKSSSLFMSCA